MRVPYSKKYQRGASLIEIVLALALLTIIVSIAFGAEWGVDDLLLKNARILNSLHVSQSKLFSVLKSGFSETEYLNETVQDALSFGVLNRVLTRPFARCENLVVSESSWRTEWGTFATTSSSILLSDIPLAKKYGGDCGGQPKEFFGNSFEADQVIELNTPVSSVDLFKNVAFASLRPTPAQQSDSLPDLITVSMVPPYRQFGIHVGNGINRIDAADQYVFTANNGSTSQLAILQVENQSGSDPHLSLIATSTLPGVTGSRPEGFSIFYADSKVYIGTKRTAGNEFHVFDVSDPRAPRWVGSKEMNHNINDIVVKNGFAFLATSGNIRDLIVLDVRDPANIVQVLNIDLPGNEDGRSIQVSANYVFLGRYKATAPDHNELCVLRYWFDPHDSTLQMDLADSIPVGGDVNGITVSGGYIFVATNNPQKELQVFAFNQQGKLTPLSDRNISAPITGIDTENETLGMSSGTSLVFFKQH